MSGLVFEGLDSSSGEEDVYYLVNGQIENIAYSDFVGAGNQAGVAGPLSDVPETQYGGEPVMGYTNSAGVNFVLFNGQDANSSNNLFVFDEKTNTTINMEFTKRAGQADTVGFDGLDPRDFVTYEGDAYFVGDSGRSDGSVKNTLWTTNASFSGTNAVGGVDGGGTSVPYDNGQMAVLPSTNMLYFNGTPAIVDSAGSQVEGSGRELWSYSAITNQFTQITSNGVNPMDMIEANVGNGDQLFFNGLGTEVNGRLEGGTLMMYNGSGAPKALDTNINPQDLTSVTFGSTTDVFFNGDSSSTNDPLGKQAGLYEISKSSPIQEVKGTAGLDPQDITALGGKVYFAGTDGISNGNINEGLWVYDPATSKLSEIAKSSNYQLDMNSQAIGSDNSQVQIGTDGTLLYFTATHGQTNQGLFAYNPATNTISTHLSGTSGSDAFNLTHV